MRTAVLIVSACWVLVSTTHAAEKPWNQFRGPSGDGQSQATGLPLTWSETENVRWKTEIKGKAWSSPVVWGKQIWVTNATEDGRDLSAVCVDADSGEIVYDILVFHIPEPQFCHSMNSYATPTPFIEQGRVYVHYGSHGTACLDTQTGKTLWSRQDLPCDHFRGAASSPIVHNGLVYINFDGFDLQYVVALDKLTGKTVWKKDRNIDYRTNNGDAKKAYGTPALITVNGQEQLVSPAAVATIAYDPRSGDELWQVRHGGMNVSARPLFGHGMVYINIGAGSKLFAVRPDGQGDVTKSHIAWTCTQTVGTRSSQILLGDRIFMVNDAGILSCVNAKTGESIWQKRTEGDHSASPIYADGRIYFFSQDGATPVIEPADEFKLLAENKLDAGFMASPAVVDNALILRTKTHLYRIEKK